MGKFLKRRAATPLFCAVLALCAVVATGCSGDITEAEGTRCEGVGCVSGDGGSEQAADAATDETGSVDGARDGGGGGGQVADAAADAATDEPDAGADASVEPDAGADASVEPDSGPGPCTGDCTHPLPGCDLNDVERAPGGASWADSYSVDGKCYCDTTYDHNIADIVVDTPVGPKTVREVCEALGPGPGSSGNPTYNDVQCGNGPANDAGDEDWCPGRVDQGEAGCCTAGPTWDFSEASW